jgi:hypothetical protein
VVSSNLVRSPTSPNVWSGMQRLRTVLSIRTYDLKLSQPAPISCRLLVGSAQKTLRSGEAAAGFPAPGSVPIKQFEGGLDAAEALRQAQCWLRDSTNGEKRDLFAEIVAQEAGAWLPRATAEACLEAVVLEDPAPAGSPTRQAGPRLATQGSEPQLVI